MKRPFRSALLACAALLIMSTVGATTAAAQLTSLADAQEQGDRSATAPVFSESADGFVYKGAPVSQETISAKALACLAVDKGPSRCYDSTDEMERAEVPVRAAAAAKKRRGIKARAAYTTAYAGRDCSIRTILTIFTGASWTGAAAGFSERGRWANLGSAINNQGSSFAMGDHSGHLAEDAGGGGYWYPYDTSICAFDMNLNLNGSGWNNRISSRYRN